MPTGRGTPVSVTPSGRTPGPGTGTAGGGATARAPARARPGTDASAGRRAIAASSGTDSRPAAAEPAGVDLGGGVAQVAAGQPVPPRVQGGRGGEAVRQAAQPRPGLRLRRLVPQPARAGGTAVVAVA